MKIGKIVAMMLTVAFVVALAVGCAKKEEDAASPEKEAAPVEAKTE